MEPSIVLLFCVLFFLSAFFSASEIAFMSLPPHVLESLRTQYRKRADALINLLAHKERLLITILIGNNLVNVLTAAIATKLSLSIAQQSGWEEGVMMAIASGVITLFILFFGEIMPKTFATRMAAPMAIVLTPVYRVLMIVLWPITTVIYRITNLLSRDKLAHAAINDGEIEALLELSKKQGIIDTDEHAKMKQILDFNETTVEEVMTPRTRIETFADSMTVQEAIDMMLTYSHSRIPVYHDKLDDANRVVTLRQLASYVAQGKSSVRLADLPLDGMLRVPLTQMIHNAFEEFRNHHKHIALVMDEYGGLAGLVTLEDIIEEVFGEIRDETDREHDPITQIGDDDDRKWHVDPHMLISDMLTHIDLSPSADVADLYGTETISYVVMDVLGRFPERQENVSIAINTDDDEIHHHLLITVRDIADGAMGRVIIRHEHRSPE